MSTLVFTGDGRCIDRPAHAELLGKISRWTRAVLARPGTRREWDHSNSETAHYEPHCNSVFEVRNLRQLVRLVERSL